MRITTVGSVTRTTRAAGVNGQIVDNKLCYYSDGSTVSCTTVAVLSCASLTGISNNKCKD
jgi:hypothetical protein